MRKFFKHSLAFEKIEFWIASGTYLYSLLYIAIAISRGSFVYDNRYDFGFRGIPYDYGINYIIPKAIRFSTYYLAFIFFTFYVVKNIINKKNIWFNIVLLGCTIVAFVTLLVISDCWYQNYLFNLHPAGWVYKLLLKQNLILTLLLSFIFICYTLIKYTLLASFSRFDNIEVKLTPGVRDTVVVLVVWLLVWLLLNAPALRHNYKISWMLFALPTILLFLVSFFKIIPSVKNKNRAYFKFMAWFCILIFIHLLVIWFIVAVVFRSFSHFLEICFIIIPIQLVITAPSAWYLYNYRQARLAELSELKTALGTSSANLNLLRSQINPHFLFNALNTLYGTALQEEAHRSAEGIQKLGDMMRFMLHENMQETILLLREVDYLKNYIDLQNLRIQASPDITIQTDIEEPLTDLQIAPMLLIPFIENAFKHGISLLEPSYIKLSFHTNGNLLHFDVQNSKHAHTENDPEKNNTGIGLENVKQRLKLMYPERHELTISETVKEFFIHLKIQL